MCTLDEILLLAFQHACAMQCVHDVIAHVTTHGMTWHDSHCA